jgi:hypothetical protein
MFERIKKSLKSGKALTDAQVKFVRGFVLPQYETDCLHCEENLKTMLGVKSKGFFVATKSRAVQVANRI